MPMNSALLAQDLFWLVPQPFRESLLPARDLLADSLCLLLAKACFQPHMEMLSLAHQIVPWHWVLAQPFPSILSPAVPLWLGSSAKRILILKTTFVAVTGKQELPICCLAYRCIYVFYLDGTVLTHRVCFSLSLPSFFSIGYQI